MKIPSVKQLQEQDYPSKYRDFVPILFGIINQFMQNITQALNGRLTFADNFDCVDVILDVTAPVTSFRIKNTKGGTFGGAMIISVLNRTNPSELIANTPLIQFDNTKDSQFLIKNVSGLTAGNRYNIRIIFIR